MNDGIKPIKRLGLTFSRPHHWHWFLGSTAILIYATTKAVAGNHLLPLVVCIFFFASVSAAALLVTTLMQRDFIFSRICVWWNGALAIICIVLHTYVTLAH